MNVGTCAYRAFIFSLIFSPLLALLPYSYVVTYVARYNRWSIPICLIYDVLRVMSMNNHRWLSIWLTFLVLGTIGDYVYQYAVSTRVINTMAPPL
jgi:hypothetical protein